MTGQPIILDLLLIGEKAEREMFFLNRKIFDGLEQAFNPTFVTGEDQDFFRRMIENGYVFVWCNEALAYEVVPPVRWKRGFMLRRALLRGKIRLNEPTSGFKDTIKSMFAVIVYLAALPFMLLFGQHLFMSYLIRTVITVESFLHCSD